MLLAQARAAVATYVEDPVTEGHDLAAHAAVAGVAERLAQVGELEWTDSLRAAARELLQAVTASGLHDQAVSGEALALARASAGRGFGGLLAAMLRVPAWQWPDAPSIARIPAALAGDYVAWFLAPPQAFAAPGDAALYPSRYLVRLEDLVRFAVDQAGSPAVRAALLAYLKRGNCIPLYFCAESLKRHYEVRARLLSCAVARPDVELKPKPRAGRRLRVGIINRHFGPQTESYTTLPTFEQLDPERFEVLLFAHQASGTPLEDYARSRAAGFTVLPADPGAQVDLLRAAKLDVAVFGTNVTAVFHEVTRLALHRVAPLQVVNNSSCTTTGMPEIDLYVSGTLTEAPDAPAHFSERLGLVAGPAHAFNYEADRQEPTGAWTRAMLGLPEDAVVFATAANFFKIIPEMQHAWAKLLAALPGSRLLVHPFNPNWSSSYPIKRFAAEFDRVLEAHGVATDRLVISSVKFPSRTDVKELLRVGDLYLDTYPFGGVNSLIDPLELGIPPVVWEGATFRARMGGALLRTLGLDELIATDEAGYIALATRLATDAAAREALKTRITDAMARTPVFLDPLAGSEAFGALLETAYDELLAAGRAAFRAERTPVRVPVPADPLALLGTGVACLERDDPAGAAAIAQAVLGACPNHPAARQLLGAALLRTGRAVRAVDYFLGAVQHVDGDAPLWQDLAIALHESGRTEQALQALETSLRIDSQRREAWELFAGLARLAGNADLEKQALEVAVMLAREAPAVAVPDEAPAVAGAAARHILVYTDDPQHGGVAQYNHAILCALAAAGHRTTCVQTASDSPLAQSQRAAGVRHVWLDYDTGRDFMRTVDDGSHARRIFAAERPDLIVFSDCSPVSNLAAREVARKSGIPYVVVVGFVGSYLAKNFAAHLPVLAEHYRAARAVVAVSQENLDLLRRQFGLPADAGQVIHYGRPEKFFAPRDEMARARLRAELGLPAEAIVCFTAARLTGVKGFGYQLRAAERLRAMPAARSVHFVWAGEGEQRGEIEREIAQLGLGGRVHLLGQRWDVADWYDAADIFVLPSHLEGMPLAIMEAMAKGLPVIATAVSGIPEELGDTGRLLPDPAKDPASVIRGLSETISTWAADAGLRTRLGAAVRTRAEAMFRESLMVRRTLELIDGVSTGPVVPVAKISSSAAVRAREAFVRGDYPEALRLATEVVKAHPRCVEGLLVLGDVALLREAALAEKVYRQAREAAPGDPRVAAALGEALLAQGKRSEARSVIFAKADRASTDLRLAIVSARWLELDGRRDDAIAVLRGAMALAPTGSEECLRLGLALKRCGCLTEALGQYRRGVGVEAPLVPVDPSVRPVRVALLVQYPQGWTSIRSVWEAFRDDPRFATTIIACPNRPPNHVEGGSDAIYGFLAERGVPFTRWTEFAFTPGFADVLFIQLPYDITRPAPLHARELMKLVPRLAYVPYALEIGGGAENIGLLTNLPLHQCAWAVFARSERHRASFARSCAGGAAHVIVTGHPKMDALRGLAAARDEELGRFIAGRRMVVWNPHYDARADGSEWGTGYSTFLRWWRFLPAEFARRPDLAFVLRPHPLFFDTLKQRGLLTAGQIDDFLARCAAAGNVHIDRRASYLPVFAAAAAMMSDASSFVLEFAATGHPLLYLHNPHGPGLNDDGAFVRDYCATAQTEGEIAAFLDGVAAGRDERGEARRAAYRREFMHLPPDGAGVAIREAVLARLHAEAGEIAGARSPEPSL